MGRDLSPEPFVEPPSGRIVCCVSSNDFHAVARAFGPTAVTGHAMLSGANPWPRAGAARAIVCQLSAGPEGELRISEDIVRLSAHTPLLVRTRLSPVAAREIARLASVANRLHVSLIGYDDIAQDLGRLLRRDDWRPDKYVIERATSRGGPRVRDILTTAAIIGRRRTTVRALARHCNLAPRTLEARIEKEGVIPANRLLGSIVSLYALWNLDVLAQPAKMVSAAMGFRSAGTLANYMCRHLGARIRELRDQDGFWTALEAFDPMAGGG